MNDTVRDPVCGMDVDPATAKFHVEHAGQHIHFCSVGCQAKFFADPARYPIPHPDRRQEFAPASDRHGWRKRFSTT
jgi:Cu+-exporting ATPase